MQLQKTFFLLLLVSLSSHASLGQIEIDNRTIQYEKKGGYAVVEGDILLGKLIDLEKKGAVIRPKLGGSRWPQGIIPFSLAEELPLKNKLAVLQAMMHWQEKTNIVFVELTSKNRQDYKDYIDFIPADGTTCSSHVGKSGGRQAINLAPRCTTMNTAHEIGHALGLWHEQSRADRSIYVRIAWENIAEEHKHNFNQQLTNGQDFGNYDYQSIMHYGMYAFSKNGEKTIIPLMDNIEIGQRVQLSDKDIAAINAMYPEV